MVCPSSRKDMEVQSLIASALAADVGAYAYNYGHPMKPHRIQLAHELITAYDMLDKMQVLVSVLALQVRWMKVFVENTAFSVSFGVG